VFYLASHRPQEAEPHLKIVAAMSRTAAAQLALADYYISTNRPREAVPILNGVGANDRPAYAAAQTRLAALEYALAQKAEAHRRLNDVLVRDAKYSPALVLNARFLLTERRLDDALRQAHAATESDPISIQARFLLGKLQTLAGKFDEAARTFTEVLKLNP